MALVQELLQRPVLEAVLAFEMIHGDFLEALLLVDRTPKYVDERVQHVTRGALEAVEINLCG